jgi:hypothetical protein
MAYYLTTPISHVNSTPHIGRAYTTSAADILVRQHRQRGEQTFFHRGSDENASKNARSVEASGVDPKPFGDRLVDEHRRLLAGGVAFVCERLRCAPAALRRRHAAPFALAAAARTARSRGIGAAAPLFPRVERAVAAGGRAR